MMHGYVVTVNSQVDLTEFMQYYALQGEGDHEKSESSRAARSRDSHGLGRWAAGAPGAAPEVDRGPDRRGAAPYADRDPGGAVRQAGNHGNAVEHQPRSARSRGPASEGDLRP